MSFPITGAKMSAWAVVDAIVAVLSGRGSTTIGIIWFDAHGDMNIPETSPSGFFDGISISIAIGDCYPGVWSRLGNTNCIPAANVLLVATRDLDPLERPRIESSPVQMLRPRTWKPRSHPS